MAQASANINIMILAARKAGRALMKDFAEVEHLQVSVKGPGDFVSKADMKAESIIQEELMEARPNYGWLGEEGKEIAGADPTRRWIVDPLDGTTNYLHAMPHWAISIALEHKGEIVAAVVFSPATEEMFVAEKGAGAWLNDSRIRVSGRRDLSTSLFATGLPFAGHTDLPQTLSELGRVLPTCSGVRRMGSAALDLAYVAAGRYDGYWERNLHIWDIAGGILMVKEAGGFIDGMRKGENPLTTGGIFATSEAIHDKITKLVRND